MSKMIFTLPLLIKIFRLNKKITMIIYDTTKIDRVILHKYLSMNVSRRKKFAWVLVLLSITVVCVYVLHIFKFIQIVNKQDSIVFLLLFLVIQTYVNSLLQSIRIAEFIKSFATASDSGQI